MMLDKTITKFPQNIVGPNPNDLIKQMLHEIGPGRQITPSAYDTAWLAQLVELDEPIGYEALNWLRDNQLEDGSWGAREPLYYHDRVICTLSAIIALAKYGNDSDSARIQKALPTFHLHIMKLHLDPAGETIAFEMLFPTLMAEGKKLGLIPRGETGKLNAMSITREIKLAKAPRGMISRFVTMAFSTEMVGKNGIHLLDMGNLQDANGSIAYSPAATTFFALHVRRKDPQALDYLRKIAVNGSVPYITPIEVFERGWALWNLSLLGILSDDLFDLCQPHLDSIVAEWECEKGIAACEGLALVEADTTSLVYEMLSRYGRSMNLNAVLRYEEAEHFRCFALEANPSVSTNIHVLGALKQAGLKLHHPSVQKTLQFLAKEQKQQGYWIDKWHASPFYPTAHAVIASAGYAHDLVRHAINWIVAQQNADGSWGYYIPTAEETAYCLQALSIWKQHGQPVPYQAIERGANWLTNHIDPPYPPLWIGKSLYTPIFVVRSAILSALMLATQQTAPKHSKNGVNSRLN